MASITSTRSEATPIAVEGLAPSRKENSPTSALYEAVRRALETVESDIASGPVVPAVTPQQIRNHLSTHYDFHEPRTLEELGADVERMLHSWQTHVTHPRYFGLFNPSVTLPSVIGDVLVAMYNPQLASWRSSPAANEIERHVLSWLTNKFGLPSNTAASFTTGGAEANLSAVIVALTRAFDGYGENGLRSLPAAPTIYLTGEAHHSFHKIAHITGLGRNALRTVATDQYRKMDLSDLALQVAADRKKGFAPFLVVGIAGTTTTGAIDPLSDIAAYCRSQGLWFHVDAAWGGAAVLSPKLKPYLAGIEAADSITCDAHKWFSVPMGAGMFFCRHCDSVGEAFRAKAAYMPGPADGTVDPYTTSVQWSRRFIGLKLFLALAQRGESGYIDMIEHQTLMGEILRKSLQDAGWKVVNSTPLPLVCFTRQELDSFRLVSELQRRQIAWMSEVHLDSAPVVRACVTSFRTTADDIAIVVREMNRLVH